MAKKKKLSERKIGVKHYLNKKLKPKIVDGVETFPIYIRISFDGQNTEIKSNWDRFVFDATNEDHENLYQNILDTGEFLRNTGVSEDKFFSNESIKKILNEEAQQIESFISSFSKVKGINALRLFNPGVYETTDYSIFRIVDTYGYNNHLIRSIIDTDDDLIMFFNDNALTHSFSNAYRGLKKYFKIEVLNNLLERDNKLKEFIDLRNELMRNQSIYEMKFMQYMGSDFKGKLSDGLIQLINTAIEYHLNLFKN